MRYRREDADGDYTFGQGDDTFLIDSPECVAQAVKTRFELWRGQWFLDLTEGTPYVQSILSFDTNYDGTSRRVTFTSSIDTIYGQTTVTSEA
ncbi:TPA: hypothetical protein N2K81_005094 [Citrobacter freundii]|nr:hypothetical protein [Citrobacter freundii]HCL5487637.1 hypothetical protein [Citrobacter freundii]HCL6740281.1 hypothetical protein [Citrobacter freundii]